MSVPLRSIRLQKRSSRSLNTLSGSSGEIFFDADNNSLRVYTDNLSDSIIIANREWVLDNTFSGNYTDLTNKPVIPTDIRDLSDIDNTLFSGDYNDLINAPDLDSLNVDITTINSIGDVDTITEPLVNGQVLQWDGVKWQNATVAGFQDTNTTYTLSNRTGVGGVDIVLTDSDTGESVVKLVAGTGITVIQNGVTNDIEISAAGSSVALNDITDVSISGASNGQVLKYNGANWVNSTDTGGIALTNLSVSVTSPGTANLSYNNTTGVFTYTPPDLSGLGGGGIALTDLSVTTSPASGGGSLSYNNTTGVFTFRPASLIGYAQLSDFSVTTNPASGSGSLSYNNTSGVFTFTPAGVSELVNDTTPQLGGDLDLNNFDIQGTGSISITGSGSFSGSVTANNFVATATGAPAITSASTITLTAPDGVTITDGLNNNIVLDAGNIVADGNITASTTITVGIGSGQPLTINQYDNITTTYGGIAPGNRASITRYNAGDGINIVASDTVNIAGGNNARILSNGPITLSATGDQFNPGPITLSSADGIIVSDGTDLLGTISIEKIDNSSDGCFLDVTTSYGNTFTEGLKITGPSHSLTFDVSFNQLGGGMLVTDGVLGLKAPSIVMNGPVSEPTASTSIVSNALAFDVSNTSILNISPAPTANYTINFTNVPYTTNRAQTYVVITNPNSFNPTAITINGGSSQGITWQGGSAPSANGNFNFYSFTIISLGGSNPFVVGSMTSYG